MTRRPFAILTSILLVLLGIKLFSYLWHKFYALDGTIVLNEGSLGLAILALALLGAGVFFVVNKISPAWTDEDTKKSSTGVLAGMFLTNLCGSGTCLPAAILSTVLSVPALICVLLGATAAKFIKSGAYRAKP